MDFEWDQKKNKLNIAKHNISFEEASEIFDLPTLTIIDTRKNYGEIRKINIGQLNKILVVVVINTLRNNRIRIISARTANTKERILYYDYLKKKTQ